jgi:hypothetical protein
MRNAAIRALPNWRRHCARVLPGLQLPDLPPAITDEGAPGTRLGRLVLLTLAILAVLLALAWWAQALVRICPSCAAKADRAST